MDAPYNVRMRKKATLVPSVADDLYSQVRGVIAKARHATVRIGKVEKEGK